MRSAAVIYVQDRYLIVAHVLGVARSQSGCADGCHLHFVRGICSAKLLKMKNSMKVCEAYTDISYTLYREGIQKLIAENLYVYSV